MAWFGGFCGPLRPHRRPLSSHPLWPRAPGVWVSDSWPAHELCTARHGDRHLAVLGPSSASASDLETLVMSGVPDDVAWTWPGSYTVVQVEADRATIWTDLGCSWPIYTLRVEGGLMWGSSSQLLAELTGYRLDLDQVAARLMGLDVSEAAPERSWFADVTRAPPGHRLTLTDNGRVDLRRVWSPRPRPSDHAQRLRGELGAAVRVRADAACTPTTDFSGGFDSTALGLLAAEHLHPRRAITGITVHPAGVTSGGDIDYAREAGVHPGVRHEFMELTEEHAPYRMLDRLPPVDEPAPSTIAYAYFSGQLSWMSERFGCDCHLTGDGGDGLLLTPLVFLADLVDRRRLLRAWKDAAEWAHLRRVTVWSALRSARADPTPSKPTPSWVTRQARDRCLGFPRALNPYELDNRTQHAVVQTMTEVGRTARSDAQIAETFGIALHNPYTDSRVLDTYLSIPLEELPGPARYKPIMRAAMVDLFPAKLARRITKGDASSDHYQGLRRVLPQLREFMDGHLAGLGLIDPLKLHRAMTRAAAGLTDELYPIESAVASEAWLRAVQAAPGVGWTTTPRAATA